MAARARTHARVLAAAALVSVGVACAPSDEVPPPDAEKQARVEQLAAVLRGGGSARVPPAAELAARLESLCRFPPAEEASRALAEAVVRTIPEMNLSTTASERIASTLYAVMNGGYLPRRVLDGLMQELEREVQAAGATAPRAAELREAARRAAREPRDPRTDWW